MHSSFLDELKELIVDQVFRNMLTSNFRILMDLQLQVNSNDNFLYFYDVVEQILRIGQHLIKSFRP